MGSVPESQLISLRRSGRTTNRPACPGGTHEAPARPWPGSKVLSRARKPTPIPVNTTETGLEGRLSWVATPAALRLPVANPCLDWLLHPATLALHRPH